MHMCMKLCIGAAYKLNLLHYCVKNQFLVSSKLNGCVVNDSTFVTVVWGLRVYALFASTVIIYIQIPYMRVTFKHNKNDVLLNDNFNLHYLTLSLYTH